MSTHRKFAFPVLPVALFSAYFTALLIHYFDYQFGEFGRRHVPNHYDWRTKPEVIIEERKAGREAYPSVHVYSFFAPRAISPAAGQHIIPFGGIRNVRTVYCNENEAGEYLIYQSDRFGFHNPDEIWDAPIEIGVIGDSFAQGACVPDGAGFVELLRQHEPRMASLGNGGNGPLVELGSLVEYLSSRAPKKVLWAYYEGNDLENLNREKEVSVLQRYLSEPDFRQDIEQYNVGIQKYMLDLAEVGLQPHVAAYSAIAPLERKRANDFSVLKFLTLSTFQTRLNTLFEEKSSRSENENDDAKLFERIILRAKNEVEGGGGTFYFLYLPEFKSFRVGNPQRSREKVLKILDEHNIPLIDIYEVFQEQGDPIRFFPFRQHGHYTEEGNAVIAAAIKNLLNLPEGKPKLP